MLASQIFNQTANLHGLGDAEGKLLHYAAILHDIGYHIGYAKHHIHGCYLVMNGELRGFAREERIILAQLVRYHRRATPKAAHVEFASLPAKSRKVIRCLSSILRIADGLDHSHFSYVNEINCRMARERIRFTLITQASHTDMELDLRTAKRHARYFEKLFGVETFFATAKPAPSKELPAERQGISGSKPSNAAALNAPSGEGSEVPPPDQKPSEYLESVHARYLKKLFGIDTLFATSEPAPSKELPTKPEGVSESQFPEGAASDLPSE
jgi:hypothetical protein